MDAIAYLRVLEAYARSNKAGSPQKAEYWTGILERHYSAALELFSAIYRADTGSDVVDGGSVDAVDDPESESEFGFASLIKRNKTASVASGTRFGRI